jgi:putative addiction module component (TIGR02574 family)
MGKQVFDFSVLTPVERIALADTLYDSAMREIDAMAPHLTPEQLAELDRRIADVEAGRIELIPWDTVREMLIQSR